MSDNNFWADRRTRTGHETAGNLAKMYNRQNYRLHPEQQQQAVEASLDDLGNFDAVKVSEVTEQVIDGHLRIELALMRFGEDFRIPVDYYDLDETETKKALMYRDLTAQMAEINIPALQELRFELPDFENPAFDEFLVTEFDFDFGGGNGTGGDTEPQTDKAEELQQIWQVQPGDLWELGPHRLICGDCTEAAVVERVMGGERAKICITDPPYNVGIDYENKQDDQKSEEEHEQFAHLWFDLLRKHSDRQIITPGRRNIERWCKWFTAKTLGAWTKNNAINRGKVSLFACWEPVFFFGEKWKRIRTNDLFDYPVSNQQDVANHPCPKPLLMWEDLIENYTEQNELIIDPFLGSGTTLIACHNLNRRCRGIEIHPPYVAVTLQRFLDHTGIEPQRVSG